MCFHDKKAHYLNHVKIVFNLPSYGTKSFSKTATYILLVLIKILLA